LIFHILFLFFKRRTCITSRVPRYYIRRESAVQEPKDAEDFLLDDPLRGSWRLSGLVELGKAPAGDLIFIGPRQTLPRLRSTCARRRPMLCGKSGPVTIILGMMLLVCGSSLVASLEKPAKSDAATPLPPGVTFRILDATRIEGIKCSLTVLLSAKVSPETLKAFALSLRVSERKNYPRTYIVYYLPGMSLNDLAWATSHFDPDLKVKSLVPQQLKSMPWSRRPKLRTKARSENGTTKVLT
jgi:hypothetical protein